RVGRDGRREGDLLAVDRLVVVGAKAGRRAVLVNRLAQGAGGAARVVGVAAVDRRDRVAGRVDSQSARGEGGRGHATRGAQCAGAQGRRAVLYEGHRAGGRARARRVGRDGRREGDLLAVDRLVVVGAKAGRRAVLVNRLAQGAGGAARVVGVAAVDRRDRVAGRVDSQSARGEGGRGHATRGAQCAG